MKKQHKQMNPLRPLGKPVYIFIFPFLFTLDRRAAAEPAQYPDRAAEEAAVLICTGT